MNKSEKSVIQQIIEDLIKLRKKQFDERLDIEIKKATIEKTFGVQPMVDRTRILVEDEETDDLNPFNQTYQYIDNYENHLWESFISDFDVSLIQLNNLLNKEEKNQSVIEIEIQMTKINMKTHLTPTEFAIKYNVSKSTQQEWRAQRKDPLPFNQKVVNGNILYVVKEVDRWFQNQ